VRKNEAIPGLLVLLFSVILHAQEAPVITALKKKYNDLTSLELTFDLDIFWKVREKHEKKSGTLVCVKGDKFRVKIGSAEWVSDGVTYWQYNEKTAQVIVKSLLDVDLSQHPSQMITDCLSHAYTVQADKDGETVLSWSSPDGDKSKQYRGITIRVDEKTTTITKICVVDKSGNESTYTFKKTKTGGPIPPETFDFEAPKGVEVLDTRK